MKLLLLVALLFAIASSFTLRDDPSVAHLSQREIDEIMQSLGPFDCGFRSNDDGYTEYFCQLGDINPGEALLDLVGDSLPDLSVDINFSELVPSNVQADICIGFPDECANNFPCWTGLCSVCLTDLWGGCFDTNIGLGDVLDLMGTFEVDLKLGFVSDAVKKAFKILDFMPPIVVDLAFNLCSFDVQFTVGWGSITIFRRNFGIIPPPYDRYTPESIYSLISLAKCYSGTIDAFGPVGQITPNVDELLLRDGVSLKFCAPILDQLFGSQRFCFELGNMTLSETGVAFCPKGVFQDVINTATDTDYACYEFGDADECSRHNDDCGACVAADGCSWCPTKGSCRGDELLDYVVDPCGGCPGDLVDTCPSEEVIADAPKEFKDEVVSKFENADLDRNTILSREEFDTFMAKWIVRSGVDDRSFDFIDLNKDGFVSMAEFGHRVNPEKYPDPNDPDLSRLINRPVQQRMFLPDTHPAAAKLMK